MTVTFEAPADLFVDAPVASQPIEATVEERPDEPEAGEQASDDASSLPPAAEVADEVVADEETFFEELRLIGELADAEREIQACESELEDLTEQRKEAKKILDIAILRLRKIASEIADLAKGKTFPKSPEIMDSASLSASSDKTANDLQPDAWRKTSTAELLDGVKGLGAKKLEAIVDLAPTAGHLEDLRVEASWACKSFKEVLPKGCGQNIADAIEDRLVEHVAKMSTPPASEQVEPRVEKSLTDEEWLDQETKNLVDDYLKQMRTDSADPEDFLPEDMDDVTDPFVAGYQAFRAGAKNTACPASAENFDGFPFDHDWLNGWCLGKAMIEFPDEHTAAGESDDDDGEYEDVSDEEFSDL